jgi:hypothetical protein
MWRSLRSNGRVMHTYNFVSGRGQRPSDFDVKNKSLTKNSEGH